MANTTLNLVGLDFESIKGNLRNYLRQQSALKDYDFEGSSLAHLVDILAYNTYINAFYLNMVGKEMFLDTAQERDSVVSHAKELNYLPRSYVSSVATVNVAITNSTANAIVIPKYTSFTTKVASNTFTFTTDEHVVLTNGNNGVFSTQLDIYEGSVVSDTFVVDGSNTSQTFVLSNPTIDTGSLSVSVFETANNERTYLFAESLHNVTANSEVYFLQPAENSQYEIVFGKNNFGKRPQNGSIIVATYRSTSGELPNGASTFVNDGPIDGSANVVVGTVQVAYGGAVQESVESIRQNAPRAFAAQGRAVTALDYKTLLQVAFPEIQSLNVYGGEDATPPQFGKVFICVDLRNIDGVSQKAKDKYLAFLSQRTPLSIDIEFVNPEFTFIEVTSNIKYNITTTKRTASEIRTLVLAAIEKFNTDEIDGFNKTLRYSKLVAAIDNVDYAIVGNSTSLRAFRTVIPTPGASLYASFSFNFPLAAETGIPLAVGGETHYGHTIRSSPFVAQGRRAVIVDDTKGTLFVATYEEESTATSTTYRVAYPVGTVSYETGRIAIESLTVDAYDGEGIKIFAIPRELDIASAQNVVLAISLRDSAVSVQSVVV